MLYSVSGVVGEHVMAIQGVSSISIQSDHTSRNLERSTAQMGRREGGGARSGKTESVEPWPQQLSAEELRQVRLLESADRRVRAHEQAHVAVGGSLVRGGATFTYATGPDNKRYAVAGEVSIDTSPGRTPQETIPKAQHIRETALAPVDPSPQDRSVAAIATQMEGDARRELALLQQRENGEKSAREGASFYLDVEGSGRPSPGGRLSVFG